jgi:hypothetical protein
MSSDTPGVDEALSCPMDWHGEAIGSNRTRHAESLDLQLFHHRAGAVTRSQDFPTRIVEISLHELSSFPYRQEEKLMIKLHEVTANHSDRQHWNSTSHGGQINSFMV